MLNEHILIGKVVSKVELNTLKEGHCKISFVDGSFIEFSGDKDENTGERLLEVTLNSPS